MSITLRRARGATSGIAAAGIALGLATPLAHSQEADGWLQGPVQYQGVGNDQCEVEFTIWNGTNGHYAVDWVVDDQTPWGTGYGTGPTGHVQWGAPNQPVFQSGAVGYRSDLPQVVTEATVDLLSRDNLPNRGSDTHTVRFRMIVGPHTPHRGQLPASGWYETTVTGCQVATTTTLDVPATGAPGTPLDLIATVSPGAAGGTVQFFDAGTPIGGPVAVNEGTATLGHTFSEIGDHAITATFIPAEPESDGIPYASSNAGPVTIVIGDTPGGSGSLGAGSLGTGAVTVGSLGAGSLGFGSLALLGLAFSSVVSG